MKMYIYLLLTPLFLVSCDFSTPSKDSRNLQLIIDKYWERNLQENPTFATTLGVRDYDNQLPNNTVPGYRKKIEFRSELLQELNEIDRQLLSEEGQLNYDLLKLEIETEITQSAHRGHFLVITNRSGPHLYLTGLVNRLPFKTEKDYISYIIRLQKMPIYIERAVARMKQGIDIGWSHACAPLKGYEKSIQTHIVENVEDSVFYKPLTKIPSATNLSASQLKNAKDSIGLIVEKLKEFNSFFTQKYLSACTPKVGISQLLGGPQYYEFLVKKYTTTNYTPKEIHDIGRGEVARIRTEMKEVIKQAQFEGSFKDFLAFLREDPRFYPKTAEQRMRAVARISKKMDGLLPELFTRFPRMPYGIKKIPLDIAEKTTTAYYQPPSGDGSKAGFYYVNTTKLNTRPLYELEALSLHEAVPGHHFQIALAQELDLPKFRKYGGFTAFVEGWGLYSERLGLEVGFYDTPYTNFGRLSYEMWRALRLVVDSGMHYFGWSRKQAINYMLENSALSKNNIVTEVDRYITWPGQALAYKIGELKIRSLRAYAEKELGAKFDKRLFHDRVLENGAIPLSILDKKIQKWVKSQK